MDTDTTVLLCPCWKSEMERVIGPTEKRRSPEGQDEVVVKGL